MQKHTTYMPNPFSTDLTEEQKQTIIDKAMADPVYFLTNCVKRTLPKRDKHDRIVLPKQWIHWARKAGLKPTGGWRGRGLRYAFYLQGKNRNWRVTCHGVFECSCPLPKFDRWANSHGVYANTFPQNEKEFLALVKEMRKNSEDAE